MAYKDVYHSRAERETERLIKEGRLTAASHTENAPLNPEITLYEAAHEAGLPIILVPGEDRHRTPDDDLVTLYTTRDHGDFLYEVRQHPDIIVVRNGFEGMIDSAWGSSKASRRTARRLAYMTGEEKLRAGRYHPVYNAVKYITDTVLQRALTTAPQTIVKGK